jgi:caffeoyl-CoA O-methyltransferase
MPLSTAHVATDRPERYAKQLISHLGNKATAKLTGDGRGTIAFRQGACSLAFTRRELVLIAAAADFDSLTEVQDVVGRHLLRFATQEELRIDWSAPIAGDELQIVAPAVEDYLLTHCTPAEQLLTELAATTREATGRAAGMQISADEGALLAMLVRLSGARRAIEIGVFTGYSSLCIARALTADGRLLACDVSSEWTDIARPFWERAGVRDRIDLRIGPALETLRALPEEPAFDFAFVDADKANYPAYYEEVVPRLVSGGLLVLDNVFLGGTVLDPAFQGEDHQAMRRVNETIAHDDRLDCVMLPVRDGVTLARKR